MADNNVWKGMTLFFILFLIIITSFICITWKSGDKYDFGNMEIEKGTFDDIQEQMNLEGYGTYQICEFETNECIIVGKIGD